MLDNRGHNEQQFSAAPFGRRRGVAGSREVYRAHVDWPSVAAMFNVPMPRWSPVQGQAVQGATMLCATFIRGLMAGWVYADSRLYCTIEAVAEVPLHAAALHSSLAQSELQEGLLK